MHKFVSLYTGAGGLDLGFIAAGFTPVFANDINADALETYRAAISMIASRGGGLMPHDVVTSDIRQVKQLPKKECAELVIGGPPCQGFSVAGKMDPDDPRSHHLFDFLGVVECIQPRAFIMENVKALARNRRWAGTIATIRKKAEEIGYKTYLDVLNSADYGVPQIRERMFLVGFRDKGVKFEYPKPTVTAHIGVATALNSLPPIGQPGNDQTCTAIITAAKKPVLRRSPFAGMLFNGQGRPMDINRPAPTLPASMGGNRTPIVDQKALKNGSPQWVVSYHNALMAGNKVAEFVPKRMRRISVQEAAAIQSFPLDMPWQGSKSSRYHQIGNAVPPKLSYAVATSVAEALGLELSGDPTILQELSPH